MVELLPILKSISIYHIYISTSISISIYLSLSNIFICIIYTYVYILFINIRKTSAKRRNLLAKIYYKTNYKTLPNSKVLESSIFRYILE